MDYYELSERSIWRPIIRAADRAATMLEPTEHVFSGLTGPEDEQGEELLSVYGRIAAKLDEMSAPAGAATIIESDPYVLA